MKLQVIYQFPGNTNWAPQYVFHKIFYLLKETYKEIEFEHINPIHFPIYHGFPSPGAFMILNPENNKRIILSHLDNSRFILYKDEQFGWSPQNIQQLFLMSDINPIRNAIKSYKTDNSKQVFYQISSNDELNLELDVDRILKPVNCTVYQTQFDLIESDIIFSKKNSAKDRENKLLFRGILHGSRIHVADKTNHSEISFTDQRLYPEDYYDELIKYRCGLSLNGVAEVSNRDLELMAVGIPIIRPLFKNVEFTEPLIPNVHYIPYDYERQPILSELECDAPLNRDYKLHIDALIDKWEEIKNDYELLEYVGNNAREWYIKNGKLDIQVNRFIDTVDLNNLFVID